MAQIGVNFGFAHIARMLFGAEVFDITNDPIAVGILRCGTRNDDNEVPAGPDP